MVLWDGFAVVQKTVSLILWTVPFVFLYKLNDFIISLELTETYLLSSLQKIYCDIIVWPQNAVIKYKVICRVIGFGSVKRYRDDKYEKVLHCMRTMWSHDDTMKWCYDIHAIMKRPLKCFSSLSITNYSTRT